MENSFNTELLKSKTYVKSNEMVAAKYKASLLENKVMSIALTKIEENKNDKEAPLEARLYPGELKKLVSDEAHIYRDLKSLAKSITGHTMFLEDGRGNFKAFSVVPNAEYQDGVFIIKFNQELKEHLFLEANFTTLELSVMTNFKRNSSFRLYELLKKDLYKLNSKGHKGRVVVEYNLFEFRFLIGIANIDNVHVQNRIKTMDIIDWEELYHTLEKNASRSDIKYKTTDKLQKDCIRPAQEELEEKSDIRFEYELVRVGRPYKKIIFHIYPNKPQNTDEINEKKRFVENLNKDNRQYEIPMDLHSEIYEEYVGHNGLAKEDIDHLMKYVNDVSDIKKAIEYTDKQEYVSNYMGYLVRCLQDRYFDVIDVEVVEGSEEKAKVIKEIKEGANSKETKLRVWEKTKKKEDFDEFLAYEEREKSLSFDELDAIFEPEDSVREYIEWVKLGRP